MPDRPIIFSAPMVRALLAGRKTQTRRLASSPLSRCAAGDRLYVREAVSCGGVFSDVVEVRYRAHQNASHTEFVEQVPVDRATSVLPNWPRYSPSIHMPRWASRLTLIVEQVRTEQLQAISEADAIVEGLVQHVPPAHLGMPHWRVEGIDLPQQVNARMTFAALWASLHTKPGERWADNPDIIALTFRVERANIDQLTNEGK
ncbi:hypothetical protein [Sphingomonas panaciterrae]|uniref:hypothetical protein n=1 Tax=Sphingomonas panaciterrae TaxID=1462999 RepID=UPI002FF34F2D